MNPSCSECYVMLLWTFKVLPTLVDPSILTNFNIQNWRVKTNFKCVILSVETNLLALVKTKNYIKDSLTHIHTRIQCGFYL